MMKTSADLERFWSKVDKSGDCWLWKGTRQSGGYGKFSIQGRYVLAHRMSYETTVGPIPEGLVIDHLCRVRLCVNPDHLEPVTDRVNILRGVSPSATQAVQTHCIHGHEFTPENTKIHHGKKRQRQCRECRRIYARAHRARLKASAAGPR